ncbi:MAG: hypothetical protein DWG76_01640, partial [Chloroflexi bacterium]|nr:hypothetical protein [Chloroflexota bacterium]
VLHTNELSFIRCTKCLTPPTIVNFVIVAFAMFVVVRGMNRLKRDEPEREPEPSEKKCPYCFTTISVKATRCPNCTSKL